MKTILRTTKKHGKRVFVDTLGNYLFFAPFVIGLTPVLRNSLLHGDFDPSVGYLWAAVPIALFGARAYGLFLKHVWYPVWGEEF